MSFIARHLSQREGFKQQTMPSEQMTFLHPAMTQDRGQGEEARRRHKGEHTSGDGTDCKVRREQKSLRKHINENGIFQIGFGAVVERRRQEALSWCSIAAVN